MLELAIWKSKIAEQTDGNNINLLTSNMKMGCLIDSLSMVDIIVPNVLSFLHGNGNEGDNGDNDDCGDDDDDNDNGNDEYGDNDDNDNDRDDNDSDEYYVDDEHEM